VRGTGIRPEHAADLLLVLVVICKMQNSEGEFDRADHLNIEGELTFVVNDRFEYGDSEAVQWESQVPESSKQAQIRQKSKRRKRTMSPSAPPTTDPPQDEEDTIIVVRQVGRPPAAKRARLHRAASQTEAAVPSGSNAPVTRRRDHRAGHYIHQPDIDLVEQGGSVESPASDLEAGSEAPPAQPRLAAPLYRFDVADEYLYDDRGQPLHDEHGAPLQLYTEYKNLSHATVDQPNKASNPDGPDYRSIKYTRWSREDALFLYREVQKVPIWVEGQPTGYVYRRYCDKPAFKERNSNQVRDKMRDLVRQRTKEKQLVLGAARHYLRSTDPSFADYKRERDEALRGVDIHKTKNPKPEAGEAGMNEAEEGDKSEEEPGERESSEEEEEEEEEEDGAEEEDGP